MVETIKSNQEQEEVYQVSARKYRPSKFSELIGQEVLVKTISNAIKNNRLAHAFILTGIRGVGKTTTARLIAKSLNCIGADGNGLETTEPCGVCANCKAIASSTHQDVIEIDAASRTGVNDMREIIDNISYSPVMARYKIYIIDEVHMLSNSAFNALLKTLEEPPAHVKFIFATTEIRKVPVTILSRCQRFDLRRFTVDEIKNNLKHILEKEGFTATEEALNLLSRAAEGSMRDGLSLLDQSISHNEFNKHLTEENVSMMLGLANKDRVYNLFEYLCSGKVEEVLNIFEELYNSSIDIKTLIQDLMDINHQITLAKTTSCYRKNCLLSNNQAERVVEIAEKISLGSITRIWQLLLKGIQEISLAAKQKMVMEMLLIRICYSSNLPPLNRIIESLNKKDLTDSDKNSNTPNRNMPEQKIAIEKFDNKPENNKVDEVGKEILNIFKDAKPV